jgi:glycosyltransferase involved in cell wall biosynthesis
LKILYIWDADYPWDVRVEKICDSLRRHGFEVHIAARNLRKSSEYEIIEGIHIHRLKTWKINKINYALSFPLFFSPIWRRFIDGIVKQCNIDLIIVRDLPMAIAGIWAGKRNNLPVIFDMAENYPAMISDIWKVRKFKGLNLIVRNPYLAKLTERYSLKKFNHIFVVIKEAFDVVVNAGVDSDNVTIIGNTPVQTVITNIECENNDYKKKVKNRYTAIYTGGITSNRGIIIVLKAIPYIVKDIPNFLFVIIGDGYAKENIHQFIINNNLSEYVLWLGWIDHKKIYSYIKESNIGLIPHLSTEHTNSTIPNKIYDYMACGIPVVSTDTVPMKRLLEEENCGVTFKSGNPVDLAKEIVNLYRSANMYGQNGLEAIRYKYNWNIEEQKLINVVSSIIRNPTESRTEYKKYLQR